MIDTIFITGVIGALILVTGAAWPASKDTHPARSTKNWLFTIGGLCMLLYSILNYLDGGSIFFVILQLFINATSVLMMCNTKDSFDTPCIMVMALGMLAWSLTLFEGYTTVFFIVGLSGIGLGYALDMGTFKRNAALTLGSALIALFSLLDGDMIFFWLNLFFAVFSANYAVQFYKKETK